MFTELRLNSAPLMRNPTLRTLVIETGIVTHSSYYPRTSYKAVDVLVTIAYNFELFLIDSEWSDLIPLGLVGFCEQMIALGCQRSQPWNFRMSDCAASSLVLLLERRHLNRTSQLRRPPLAGTGAPCHRFGARELGSSAAEILDGSRSINCC
jgi:hypothetical protein